MINEWFRACRPMAVVLVVLLFMASYALAGLLPSQVMLFAVVWITVATMLQNDWRDREHDRRKGKTLAIEHPNIFLTLTLVCWTLAIATTVVVVAGRDPGGVVLIFGIIIGLIYSETRQIPLVSMTLVALCSALPGLIPLLAGSASTTLWFFVAVFSVILAREITKDQDDMYIDRGYKRTLPLAIGRVGSNYVVALLLCVSVVACIGVSTYLIVTAMLLGTGAILAVNGASSVRVRCQIDLGIVLTALMIIVIK